MNKSNNYTPNYNLIVNSTKYVYFNLMHIFYFWMPKHNYIHY